MEDINDYLSELQSELDNQLESLGHEYYKTKESADAH